MINMSHNGNYWGSWWQSTGFLALESLVPLNIGRGSGLKMCLITKICNHGSRCFIVNDLVNVGHNAVSHQVLDNLYGADLYELSQQSHC